MADFLAGNIPIDCNPLVQDLVEYWLSIHPPHGLPGRQHLDPCDFPQLLQNLVLVDVQSEPVHFTWRLMGTSVTRIFGRDHTGSNFLKAYQRGLEANAYVDMNKLITDRQPRWRRGAASFERDKKYLTVERVFLPLARDGKAVDMAIGMILAHTSDGTVV